MSTRLTGASQRVPGVVMPGAQFAGDLALNAIRQAGKVGYESERLFQARLGRLFQGGCRGMVTHIVICWVVESRVE